MVGILSREDPGLFCVITSVDFKRPEIQSEPDCGISLINTGRQGQDGRKLILDARMGMKPERFKRVSNPFPMEVPLATSRGR